MMLKSQIICVCLITIIVSLLHAADSVNITVPGTVPLLKQPKDGCWAACTAMMVSWRDKTSYSIETVISKIGKPFTDYLQQQNGLPSNDWAALAQQTGWLISPRSNITVNLLKSYLEKGTPLIVLLAGKDTQGKDWVHGVVVTGLKGDGTISGTDVFFNDPLEPKKYQIKFEVFQNYYEKGAEYPVQIMYYPSPK